MKKRIVEFNVLTGVETVTEVEMTEEEIALEQEQIRKSEIQHRLQEIVAELQQTDYKAIKFAEGIYTDEEYADTKFARKTLRDEFNILELELTKL